MSPLTFFPGTNEVMLPSRRRVQPVSGTMTGEFGLLVIAKPGWLPGGAPGRFRNDTASLGANCPITLSWLFWIKARNRIAVAGSICIPDGKMVA
jgi:hypothetical protein